jgi:glycosyltransferase involved in cell wall biosynthesis
MKLHLENVNLNSSSGPNSFAKKIVPNLVNLGYEITNISDADLSLCFIESPRQKLNIPQVLRLDGIYFNTAQNYNLQNQNILRTYQMCEGVVYQSEFNKELIERYFGKHKNSTVIHNGADLESIKKTPAMKNDVYENVWCCASSWRPHKRLKDNIRYFLEHSGEKDLLVVAGNVNPEDKIEDKKVAYFGNLSQQQLYSVYKASKYFLHLAWLDHCPNVVVDAYASGCQIICSSAGGTKEIAGDNAIVVEEEDWDFKPVELYNPPTLDFSRTVLNKTKYSCNIKDTAELYHSFLEKTYESRV